MVKKKKGVSFLDLVNKDTTQEKTFLPKGGKKKVKIIDVEENPVPEETAAAEESLEEKPLKKKVKAKKTSARKPAEEETKEEPEETEEEASEEKEEDSEDEEEPSAKTGKSLSTMKLSGKVKGRLPTGVINLDPLIQGGLKQGSITLVTGDAGSGKTILTLQFIYQGLRQGEACLYLTFEEKKEKLYGDMVAFNMDFRKYEERKKFFYLEYSPEQVKSLIEEGGGTIDQLISKKKITRLVIDSITSFSLLYQDELSKKEAGLALFELINKWGCTAVLTSQAEARGYSLESSSLEFEADCIILLYHFREQGHRTRCLEILKMRGTKHANKTMRVEITADGLVVHPNEIIKVN